jgi:hypothetical protein
LNDLRRHANAYRFRLVRGPLERVVEFAGRRQDANLANRLTKPRSACVTNAEGSVIGELLEVVLRRR